MHRHRSASLDRSVLWFVVPYALAVGGYLALLAAASRLTGATEFGTFVVVVTATTLLGQFGLLGVHRSGLREAARITDHGSAELGHLRDGVHAVTTVALPAVSLAAAGIAWTIADGSSSSRLVIASCVGAMTFLNGVQKISACFLRGLGSIRVAGLIEGRSGGAAVALGQAAFTGLTLWAFPHSGLEGALLAATLGFAMPVLGSQLLLHRTWRAARRTARRWSSLRVVARRDWKFTVVQVGAYANSTLDLWLCALLLGPLATSLFGASQRVAQLLLIPMTSLQVVFSPAISRMSAAEDLVRLQRLVRTGSTIATAVTGVLWLPMLLLPGALLVTIFGAGFTDGAAILVLLATGYLMNAVSGLSGVTLSMAHFEGYVAAVHWIGLGVRVVVGTAAAVTFGVVGLAASSVLATVTVYALMWTQARRRVGVSTHATFRPHLRMLTKVAG